MLKLQKEIIRFLVLVVIALTLTACPGGGGGGGTNAAPAKALVTSVQPSADAVGVPVNSAISATFSSAMNPATFNSTTFYVKDSSGALVPGSVSYSGVTATFTPTATLNPQTTYIATISNFVTDSSGNYLDANYSWSFITGAPDLTPPSVSSTNPADGATWVPINSSITATFSEALLAATINNVTFTLRDAANTQVAGTVSYSGTTATFTPTSDFKYSTKYFATISSNISDLSGNNLIADYTWTFSTGAAPDTTPPQISRVIPAPYSILVDTNTSIAMIFTEAMDPLTVTTASFTVEDMVLGKAVTGTVSYTGNTAVFTPSAALTANRVHVAKLSTGAKDISGNSLATPYERVFSTGASTDTSSQSVFSVVPANGSTGAPINSAVVVTFNEPVDPSTVNTSTFIVKDVNNNAPVVGTVSCTGFRAYFVPKDNFSYPTFYLVTIKKNVKDLAGNPMSGDHTVSFTTGNSTDATQPTVASNVPAYGATAVYANSAITATFSEEMDAATINTATFTVRDINNNQVPGLVWHIGKTAKFIPDKVLAPSTFHMATLTTGVKDIAGNSMALNHTWSFTTGSLQMSTIDSFGDVGAGSSIAVDSNNRIHVSYYDRTNSAIKYATNMSGTWVSSTVATNVDGGGSPSRSIIKLDSNNKVHIIYYDYNSGINYITNLTGAWTSSFIAAGSNFSMIIDSSDKLHISYSGGRLAASGLYYATNVSGTWISSIIDNPAQNSVYDSSIAIDKNGNLHILSYFTDWSGGRKAILKYANNSVGSWSIASIDNNSSSYNGLALAVDSNLAIHAIYGEYPTSWDLKYITNASGAWVTSTIGKKNDNWSKTSIAIDSTNKVHACAPGTQYITNSSGAWKIDNFDDAQSIACALDFYDKAHIAYYAGSSLKYASP